MSWTRRDFLLRTAVLGAAVTAGCTSTVRGAPQPDPAATPQPETGTSAPPSTDALSMAVLAFQPYTVDQGGQVSGPVPDVARAVLETMDITEVEIVTFRDEATIVAGVVAGQFDLVGGLPLRADLCPRLVYSIPDIVSGTALIVPNGNPRNLVNYPEIVGAGAKVAVLNGAPEHQDALGAGVPAPNVVPVPVPHQLIDAVRNGQADCAAFDDITARDLVRTLGDGEVSTAQAFMPLGRLPYIGAYAFPRDSSELREPFNAALRELHESGEWLELVEPYGLSAVNDPPADLNEEQVCGS